MTKRIGDKVNAAKIVCEVETDKAVVEIESPCAGRLATALRSPGSTVRMGETPGVVKSERG